MAEYRIVRDAFLGYEVQLRTWYWPFWRMANMCNTFPSVERAVAFARDHAAPEVKRLGRLPRRPVEK